MKIVGLLIGVLLLLGGCAAAVASVPATASILPAVTATSASPTTMATTASPTAVATTVATASPMAVPESDRPVVSTPEESTMTESNATAVTPDVLLFRFDDEAMRGRWTIVNDGVMGGVSQSTAALTEDGWLRFTGDVSLENNGGFASIRSLPARLGIGDAQGMRLVVRGDGQRYQLRLYTEDNPNISFQATFETVAGEMLTIDIPFTQFVPTFRGRVLDDVGPLAPAMVVAVGFLIADYQTGPFQLEVASVAAYRE